MKRKIILLIASTIAAITSGSVAVANYDLDAVIVEDESVDTKVASEETETEKKEEAFFV